MRKLFIASSIYLALGLSSGLFYREFTKAQDFTSADGVTQLSVAHTHLLTLGVIVLLIVMVLEKVFELSQSRAFTWFFWIYNLGLAVTAGSLLINGSFTVLGVAPIKALEGISGSGHILLTAGFVLLFVALGTRVNASQAKLTPSDAQTDNSL